MKKSPLILACAMMLLPACQSAMERAEEEDMQTQLAAYSQQNANLRAQVDRARAQNDALEDELEFQRERNSELGNRVQAMEATLSQQNAEVDDLRARLAGSGVDVESRGGFIVLGLPSALTFPSGSAELSPDGKGALDTVVDILKSDYAERTFWVEGHTDTDKPSKSGWDSNLELSVARAMAVADYMIDDLGVAGERVRVAGHGEYDPKAENDTAEGKAMNRRVEILVLP